MRYLLCNGNEAVIRLQATFGVGIAIGIGIELFDPDPDFLKVMTMTAREKSLSRREFLARAEMGAAALI